LLKEYLLHQRVTHLALLRNWFEVVNVPPLFQTDERTPEIMEVFAFDEQRAHFTTSQVSWLTANGAMALARGDLQQGGPLTERAVKMDPMSSRARHHFGWALLMAGRFDQAEAEFRAAIGLYPDYWPAHYALAQVALRRGQPAEALKRLQTLVAAHPSMHAAFQSMAQIQAQLGDTTGARESLERLRVLEPQNRP
jgi:Tfp pilus assembly protein PilF